MVVVDFVGRQYSHSCSHSDFLLSAKERRGEDGGYILSHPPPPPPSYTHIHNRTYNSRHNMQLELRLKEKTGWLLPKKNLFWRNDDITYTTPTTTFDSALYRVARKKWPLCWVQGYIASKICELQRDLQLRNCIIIITPYFLGGKNRLSR